MTWEEGASEAEPISVPLSALEHVVYCARQAALIHVEGMWAENLDTVRGDLVHRAVDMPGIRQRRGVKVVRALPVHSRQFGLHGVCDLVEFTGERAAPVEYKVGAYHPDGPADIQVAAQAACLIERGFSVPVGYVYCAADRRRHEVQITELLLDRVRQAADSMRAVLARPALPLAPNDRRCRRCSLRDDCLPELTGQAMTGVDLFRPRPLGAWRD